MFIIWWIAFSPLGVAQNETGDNTASAEIDDALKQAADAIRRAQNPADLDSVLENLRQLKSRVPSDRPVAPQMFQALRKAEAALQFVARWQDYLSEAGSGNTEEAHEILQNLSQTDQIGLIPRSEILARIHGPAPALSQAPTRPVVKELLDRIKTLDDMSAALETLKKWSVEDRGPRGEIQSAIAALAPLDGTYREFKAGLATKIEGFLTDARLCPAYVISLRAQLLALLLPRYLGLPEEWKPRPDEGVHAFLDRVATDALEHRNYILAARAREVQYFMKYGMLDAQKSQAAAFITAHNQEEAGQYALAVASYQKALATGTEIVPPKVIGERLAVIQKEHPTEYAEGMRQFLAPPMPQYPRHDPFDPAPKPPNRSSQILPVPAISVSPSVPSPK